MKRLLALALALLVAGPVAAQASHSLELLRGEDVGIIPRYLLQDPNGRAISQEEFRGRFQLISFGYTYCPDICPTTLVEMAEVLKQLGDRAARVQAIFISVDPERDTPDVLRQWVSAFNPRLIGLTGTPQEIARGVLFLVADDAGFFD